MKFDLSLPYAFLFCLLAILAAAPAPGAFGDEIRIGAIASLTGHAAEQGKNWLNGAKLAEADLNAKGISLILTVEDDGTNPSRAVSAFRKMVDFNHVQIVLGGTWDFLAEAIVPLAHSIKLPFITMTNSVEILSREASASPYVFTNALSLAATEEAMRAFFIEKRPKSLAILTPNFPFTLAHADIAEKLAKEFGIPLSLRTNFSYDDFFQTVKVLATKVIRSKAEMVFIPVSAEALDPFAVTFGQQGGKAVILNTQHLDAAFAMTSQKIAYRNAYSIYPSVVDPDFSRRYAAKFGSPPRVYSAEGYDALMFAALARAKGVDIADGKTAFEYEGVTGHYAVPAIGRQLGQIRAAIMTTRSGKFEPAAEFTPQAAKNHAGAASAPSATGVTGSKAGSQASE